jgi:putative ABC transport system permease protein
MKISDLLLLSTRTFKTRPTRTFLTVLGVSVGIGAVLFLVSLGYGLQNAILNKITSADALLSLDVSAGGLITLDRKNLEEISKIEKVTEISPMINLSAQLTLDDLTSDGLIYACPASFFRLSGSTARLGRFFSQDDAYEIVISTAGAKLFNIEPDQIIGKEISLTLFITKEAEDGSEDILTVKRDQKYKVVGIVDDENTNFIYLPIKTIEDLNINEVAQAKVKVSSNEYMEGVRNQIIEKGFLVSSLSDTIDQANKIFRVIQIILGLFGLVALTVSAIGMINTMTITLLERTQEIGIMRSIGASQRNIKMLFLIEALLMGFLGGLGGVIMGYLGGELANLGINLLAKNFGGQALNLFYRPLWFIGVIITSSAIVGFITGIYPAHRASKLNPLDALKYK